MKTNIVKTAIMTKKQYSSPLCEIMHLDPDMSIMKELGPASLPGEGGAPARRPGHGGSEAPVF